MVEACSHGSGPGNRDQGGSLENLTFQCLSLVIYPASQAPPPKGSTTSNTALRAEGQTIHTMNLGAIPEQPTAHTQA